MLTSLINAAPLLLAVLAALAVTIFATLTLADAWRQRGPRRAEAVLTTLMRATGPRRDRAETLSTTLSLLRRELAAATGLIAQSPSLEAPFALVSAEAITRLDLVLQRPGTDPIVADALEAASHARLRSVPEHSVWTALSHGRSDWLVALAFGTASARALLVLCWPDRSAAARAVPVLDAVAPYLSQVLADFVLLDRRARELQMLNTALRDQELLVRTAAHDLGNALVEPNLFVTELEGQLPAELEPERASAEHRLAMIGSMLADLVDPGRPLEREAVPVEELVQLAVPLFAALRPQGPPLALDVPAHLPPLWIDRVAVLRVLANLLTNAAVHNADRAELSVRLCVRADDDATVIEVADTGRGIAPEDQARIFEFGVRVDPDGRTRGHGLGLSSSRRLVEAHGGTLSVESQPGHGAAFRMRLPLAPSPDRPGRPA